jgi:hypothetical protein
MTLHDVASQLDSGAHPEALNIDRQVAAILWNYEEDAFPYADGLIEKALALTAPEHTLRFTLLKRRGKLYREQSRFGEALQVLQFAVEQSERLLGSVHAVTRRLRVKLCKVLERMTWRSGLSEEERESHYATAQEHYMSARRRAQDNGQPAVAAVLLADLAGFWAQRWHSSHHSQEEQRYQRTRSLYEQARDELIAVREQLPEALREEPGVACASLGQIFALNFQWADAAVEYRRALNMLGREHTLYSSVRNSLQYCSQELRMDEDERYYQENPRERDRW